MAWRDLDNRAVSGIFRNREELEAVLQELDEQELREETSVLMTGDTRSHYEELDESGESGYYGYDRTQTLPAATGTGAVTGGILGAIIGGLSAVGSVFLPGSGLLIAGPLFGALAGGALGAATGGLIGALVGAGIPEEEARYYEQALGEKGAVLLIAHVHERDETKIKQLFRQHGAEMVHAY